MAFLPISGGHSIQEVTFALLFPDEISQPRLRDLQNNPNPLIDRLPKLRTGSALRFKVTNENGMERQEPEVTGLAGIALERFEPDGTLEWRLKVQDNWLTVTCFKYTRWQDTWSTAKKLLSEATETGLGGDLPVAGCALQYIDRFLWDAGNDQYDAHELFKQNSELLPDQVFQAGNIWHNHIGWFDQNNTSISGRLLNKINVDSFEESEKTTSQIDINLQYRFNKQSETISDFLSNKTTQSADVAMQEAHDRNIALIRSLLQPDVCERIGLDRYGEA